MQQIKCLSRCKKKVVSPNIKSIVTVYQTDDKWKDICAHFNKYQLVKYEEALNNKNIEKLLGEVCIGGKEELCEKPIIFTDNLYTMGMQKDDKEFGYLINDRFGLRASLVDVNNDGKDELRIWRRAERVNDFETLPVRI